MVKTTKAEREANKVREQYRAGERRTAALYMKGIRGREDKWYGDNDAARLVQVADCFGVTLTVACQYPHLLEVFGIDHPIEKEIFKQAQRLLHKWDDNLATRTRGLQPDGPAPDQPADPDNKKRKNTKKAKREPVVKDAFGSREGSKSHAMNAAILTHNATNAAAMSEHSGESLSRAKAHIKWLAARELIVVTGNTFVVNSEKTQWVPKPRKSKVVYAIWDINCCSILRWMGSKNWDFDRAVLAVETMGCGGMSFATMKLHHTAGCTGNKTWGKPAKLTSSQRKQLKAAAE